ncbi:hypothetical protein RHECIAT_PC0000735 (plasmid) [Rhizobium etli CIAT 652]|uniref:Uncharacterized protein n=1 Tax=Rhizobium etli (strain CIAT 652) TaxID=491916 RepID=B3Q408_RHIE6|nr:hypothetical protein RHECIAT_PC0000735 [Rhizobium etli CIAT 652]
MFSPFARFLNETNSAGCIRSLSFVLITQPRAFNTGGSQWRLSAASGATSLSLHAGRTGAQRASDDAQYARTPSGIAATGRAGGRGWRRSRHRRYPWAGVLNLPLGSVASRIVNDIENDVLLVLSSVH